jgi:hypothetical protein
VTAAALPTLKRKIRHPKIWIKLRPNTDSWKSASKSLNHTTGHLLFQGNRYGESLVLKKDYLEGKQGKRLPTVPSARAVAFFCDGCMTRLK